MSNVGTNYYDDKYTIDSVSPNNALFGKRIVQTRFVNGDTSQKDFTPDTGTSNYSRLTDAVPDGDSSYVKSGNTGAKDLYSLGNLSDVPSEINGVAVKILARKDNSATRELRAVIKSGSSEAYGAPVGLPNNYKRVAGIFETDPATGAAWTSEGVNAAQIGFQVVT